MDPNITDLISNIGFPIIMCLYMVKHVTNLESMHKDEIDKLRSTIDNNTTALTLMVNKLDVITNDINKLKERIKE